MIVVLSLFFLYEKYIKPTDLQKQQNSTINEDTFDYQ